MDFVNLGEKNIKTLDNLADLSSDELIEIIGNKLKKSDADKIIMDARKIWFKDEENSKKDLEKEDKIKNEKNV